MNGSVYTFVSRTCMYIFVWYKYWLVCRICFGCARLCQTASLMDSLSDEKKCALKVCGTSAMNWVRVTCGDFEVPKALEKIKIEITCKHPRFVFNVFAFLGGAKDVEPLVSYSRCCTVPNDDALDSWTAEGVVVALDGWSLASSSSHQPLGGFSGLECDNEHDHIYCVQYIYIYITISYSTIVMYVMFISFYIYNHIYINHIYIHKTIYIYYIFIYIAIYIYTIKLQKCNQSQSSKLRLRSFSLRDLQPVFSLQKGHRSPAQRPRWNTSTTGSRWCTLWMANARWNKGPSRRSFGPPPGHVAMAMEAIPQRIRPIFWMVNQPIK